MGGTVDDMNRYIAVLLFTSRARVPDSRPLHREDIALVHAADDAAALVEAERHARGSAHTFVNALGETVDDEFVQVVDVAPLLYEDLGRTTDLYCRHFRDLDAYRRFDPLLDGEPL